jgi:pyruvate/2-oxoglutarate dehydrogenase complex dihydrolipoamide acyltransferase (E2) component
MDVALVAAGQEPLGPQLVAAVLVPFLALLTGKVIAYFKERAKQRGEADKVAALEALEVGVHEAWEQLGKQLKREGKERARKVRAEADTARKAAAGDSSAVVALHSSYDADHDAAKLPETDKLRLRQLAVATAERVAARRGVDLTKVLGPGAVVGMLIRRIVDRRKRDAYS